MPTHDKNGVCKTIIKTVWMYEELDYNISRYTRIPVRHKENIGTLLEYLHGCQTNISRVKCTCTMYV